MTAGRLWWLVASFALALLAFGRVVRASELDGDAWYWAIVVVVLGVGSYFGCRLIERHKPLDCGTDGSLLESYRSRIFLRIAFAEVPALLAFFFAFAFGPGWLYYVGMVISLVLLARAAPTQRALQADQRDLDATGCGRSLPDLLNQLGSGPG